MHLVSYDIGAGNRCSMCGKMTTVSDGDDHKKNEQLDDSSSVIAEQIDGTSYTFDTADCAMMFKRFSSVYGSNFADE